MSEKERVLKQDLSMSLSGNQISSVATYDAKGRQTAYTQGSSRTVTYNLLDLPLQETIGSAVVIDRKYGADGTRLQEKVTTSGSSVLTRDYIGNLIYENGSLKNILFDGGYVDMTGSSPAYRFYLTDHLGSVRVVAAADGTVMQVNHYYPYGGLMTDPRHTIASSVASDSRYRFIGKELSEESGEYDFGARYLDPAPGRFNTLDPLAEKYNNLSPYAYCAGNPISFVDPDGRDDFYFNSKGYWTKVENNDPYDRLIPEKGDPLIVKNRSVMQGMQERPFILENGEFSEKRRMHYSIMNDSSELNEVFLFLANHSQVEWLLIKGQDDSFLLGTQHLDSLIDENAFSHWTKNDGSSVFADYPEYKVHNHSGEQSDEIGSMDADYYNYIQHPNTRSFVYFSESGNTYEIMNNNFILMR